MFRSPRRAVARSLALPAEPRLLAALTLATGLAAFAPMAFGQNATPPEPRPDAAAEQPADAAAPAEGEAAAAAPAADAAAGDTPPESDTAPAQADSELRQAAATLRDGEGADIGTVLITETESGVMHFVLDIVEGGLPAGAQRAVHIHETGVCEGPTFESAGGHLAEPGEAHGVHSADGPHSGDLPNITMGAAGALHTEFFLPGVLMDRIMDGDGAALVVHSDVDDYATDPAGNAGDRIACGVLELEG